MSYDETEHAHLVYECQPFTVVCVKCKQATETGSQMSLEIEGWQLTDLGEVCGKCTKRIVRESLQHSQRRYLAGKQITEPFGVRAV